MANPPTDKDIVAMVVNTVNHWRQQRAMHAQKVAEYDALLNKIGIETDKSILDALPKLGEGISDFRQSVSGGPPPMSGSASTPQNVTPPKIKISPFISGESMRRANGPEQKDNVKAAQPT